MLLHLIDSLPLGDLLETCLAWKVQDGVTASLVTHHYRALVQLDSGARVCSWYQQTSSLMDLVGNVVHLVRRKYEFLLESQNFQNHAQDKSDSY